MVTLHPLALAGLVLGFAALGLFVGLAISAAARTDKEAGP